jgi:hypothetical protein
MRTPISLADALHAAAALAPRDAEARAAIEELLGLSPTSARSVVPLNLGPWKASADAAVGHATAERSALSVPSQSSVASPDVDSPPPGALTVLDIPSEQTARVTRVFGERRTPRPPQWWETHEDIQAEPAAAAAIPVPPLLAPRIDRAIVAAALATYVEEGDVDVDLLIERVASGEAIETVPRQVVQTLRRGAQVLIDAGPGMDPYRQDVSRLIDRFKAIARSDLVMVEPFLGCPSRGDDGSDEAQSRWSPPPPGTPVVVVTDLGIGGPIRGRDRATPLEWLAFARSVRAAGHPLIGFVPYEPRRWPPRLARTMTLLHWSERTRIGTVKRAMREASRARP